MSLDTVLADVNDVITAITGVLDVADPAAGATLSVIAKVLAGVATLEPTAVALVNQIEGGTDATAAQLQAAETACHESLSQLDADIIAKEASAS